jgi:hypothetical protein
MAIRQGYFALHASAIIYQDEALLFSAPSGVGKSTHAELWQMHLPKIEYLNDDKPLLSIEDGILYALGTPWCGKTERTAALKIPVKAIVFLSRGVRPRVRPLAETIKLALFLKNGYRSREKETADRILNLIDQILSANIPIIGYETDISENAFQVIYQYLYGGGNE